MSDKIRKLKCWLGYHENVEVIDHESTEFMRRMWPFKAEITPCTYLKCKHCGHGYSSRTMGVSFTSEGER